MTGLGIACGVGDWNVAECPGLGSRRNKEELTDDEPLCVISKVQKYNAARSAQIATQREGLSLAVHLAQRIG